MSAVPPLQRMALTSVALPVSKAGSETTTEALTAHPLASVTV